MPAAIAMFAIVPLRRLGRCSLGSSDADGRSRQEAEFPLWNWDAVGGRAMHPPGIVGRPSARRPRSRRPLFLHNPDDVESAPDHRRGSSNRKASDGGRQFGCSSGGRWARFPLGPPRRSDRRLGPIALSRPSISARGGREAVHRNSAGTVPVSREPGRPKSPRRRGRRSTPARSMPGAAARACPPGLARLGIGRSSLAREFTMSASLPPAAQGWQIVTCRLGGERQVGVFGGQDQGARFPRHSCSKGRRTR